MSPPFTGILLWHLHPNNRLQRRKQFLFPQLHHTVSCSPGLQAAYLMVETLGRKILQVSSAEHKMETQKTTDSTFSISTGIVAPTPGRKGARGLIGTFTKNKQQAPLPMPLTSSAIIQTDKAENSRNTTKFNFWWTQCTAT